MSTLIRTKTISELKEIWSNNAKTSTTKLSLEVAEGPATFVIQSQLIKIIYNDKLFRKIKSVQGLKRR